MNTLLKCSKSAYLRQFTTFLRLSVSRRQREDRLPQTIGPQYSYNSSKTADESKETGSRVSTVRGDSVLWPVNISQSYVSY